MGLVGTRTRAKGIKIYVNGVLTTDTRGGPCGPPPSNDGNLLLGRLLKGSLDDVIIYNKVLTQAEVTQLYELPPCCE